MIIDKRLVLAASACLLLAGLAASPAASAADAMKGDSMHKKPMKHTDMMKGGSMHKSMMKGDGKTGDTTEDKTDAPAQ